MQTKYHEIYELAKAATRKVTGSAGAWMKYLDTAARLYKYPFEDQILIYAQKPEAAACAPMKIWNEKMFCWVNRGAKGIALIDADRDWPVLHYVFDVSDVHPAKRIGKKPYLWKLEAEHETAVMAQLEKTYGETDESLPFEARIMELSMRIAGDYCTDLMPEIADAREGSFLEELDELSTEIRLRDTLSSGIAYTLLSRCGADMEVWAEELNFEYISDFNTPKIISVLGTANSELCRPIFEEIGKTITEYNRKAARDIKTEKAAEKTKGHLKKEPQNNTGKNRQNKQNNLTGKVQNHAANEVSDNVQSKPQNNVTDELINNVQSEPQNNVTDEVSNSVQSEPQNNGMDESINSLQSEPQNNQTDGHNNPPDEVENNSNFPHQKHA